jgi:hypothetical protein
MATELLPLKDVIDIANSRFDAYQDLWKFYAVIVGGALALAKVRFGVSHPKLITFGLPALFLICVIPNLLALLKVASQRHELTLLAMHINGSEKWQRPFLSSLDADAPYMIAVFHIGMDIGLAIYLHFVARSTAQATPLADSFDAGTD